MENWRLGMVRGEGGEGDKFGGLVFLWVGFSESFVVIFPLGRRFP